VQPDVIGAIRRRSDQVGLSRLHVLAWRDLADVEAGGSEVHIDEIASVWAQAGLAVTMRTSHAPGHPIIGERNGYRVVRRAGRYLVFPRAAVAERMGGHGPADGLIEIWNGMPFGSPVWARTPRIVLLHHVHGEVWRMVLPPHLAKIGELIEHRLAPPFYRSTPIVTLSNSSKEEMVTDLGFDADLVHVVPPGIDPSFSPGGERSPVPEVLAVGRLVPVKRVDRLIRAVARVRDKIGEVVLTLVGTGYEQDALQEVAREVGGQDWVRFAGRVDDQGLIDAYRRAWVVASSSAREGWGMTLTEAAACGTPSVATRIAGHVDAVEDGVSGLLANDDDALVEHLHAVLSDPTLRAHLSEGAAKRAAELTWGRTATDVLSVLADEVERSRR